MDENKQRLQKILSAAGYGSRRACEDIVSQGRVSVNGRLARLGDKADPQRDDIRVDGARLRPQQPHTYVVVYKPRGVVSTAFDERGRKTVRDLVALDGELVPVGRLDLNSEGLVLLTDDGALTHRLTHPRYKHPKEYHVRVDGQPNPATLARWRRGVRLPDFDEHTRDGGLTAPAEVDILRPAEGGAWLRIVMHEGRKRQIRRVANLLGHPVRQLIRVGLGSLQLGTLKPGQWRHLSPKEVKALRREAGL